MSMTRSECMGALRALEAADAMVQKLRISPDRAQQKTFLDALEARLLTLRSFLLQIRPQHGAAPLPDGTLPAPASHAQPRGPRRTRKTRAAETATTPAAPTPHGLPASERRVLEHLEQRDGQANLDDLCRETALPNEELRSALARLAARRLITARITRTGIEYAAREGTPAGTQSHHA